MGSHRRATGRNLPYVITQRHGGLLQLAVSWCFQSATQQVAVRIQRRCTDLLVQEVGAHHTTVA